MSRIILPSIRNSKSLTLFTSCLLMVALWLPFSASAQTCIGPLVVPITGAGTGNTLGITSLQATGVPTSCGASNGSISVTISGGTAPYTYVISTSASAPCTTPLSGYAGATFTGASTTHLFSALPAGSYYFCITDANGCSVRSTIPFTLPSTGIQISSTAVVNASCGTANGSATVYATGGTTYTYAWTGGQTSQTATGLTAGIYTVTVTATGGCTATAQVAITNVGGPVVTAAVTPATCPSSNGSADITITGGTVPYTIVWTGSGSGTDPRTGLAPGSYGVQVTDATGCVGTLVVAVGASSPITANVVSNSPSCGQSNGTATVSAANGTAPYTYTWNTGATGASQTNLAAGAYSVTITDANSCTTVYQFTLNNSSQTATLTISGTSNVTCPGLSNGSVTASVSGGGTFTVTNAAGVTFPANALPAGTYTVAAFTSGGCVVSSQQITITQPANIQASLNFVPTACNGTAPNSATVTFTGGTAPYTVAWSDGSTANPRTAIPQGSYTVTVMDSRGCPYTFPFTVGPPPCPLNSFADVCAIVNPNGTVQICASPQLGYQNENFTVLQGPQLLGTPSGAPGVLVNPATGQACFTYNATDIDPYAFSLVDREEVMTIRACNPVIPTQCDDFTIRVLVNDPPTVALPGQTAIDNILETTRRIRPGDALTICTFVLNVDQYCNTNLADVPQQPNQIGPLLPGATATWVSDATIAASLPPPNQGAYAPVGDNQWCVVYNSPYLPGATDTIQTIFCDPAPYSLCDTFRLIIQLYDVPDIVSLAGSGSYVNDVATVTVNPNSNTTNCMGFDPYHRNETMTIIDAPNLAGATASLGAQPLDTCVTYHAPNMPGSTDFILISACNPAALTLCDTLRINYIIACPITTLASTVVSDATSCIGSGSACLPITQTQLTQWNGTILVDGSTYSGAVTSCNGGAGVSIVLAQGTHTIQVNYGVGCSAATTVTVAGPPPLTFVGVTSTNTTQCGVNDGTLIIELDNPGIAPFTVTSNGQPLTGGVLSGNYLTFSNLAAGTYGPFNITNGLSCNVTSATTTAITAPTSPTITSATFTNPTACIAPNNTGTLNIVMGVAGTAPYTWTLNGNSVTPTGTFPNFTIAGLAVGSYAGQNLVVTAANGCTATFALTGAITAPAAPVVTSVTPTNATCGQTNGTLTINMSTAATNYTYVWNPSTGTPNAAGNARTGLAAGTYTITITTTATGCTATATGSVNSSGGATVTAGTITPATCLAANGSVVINVTGGTAPYTITRSGSGSSQNLAAAGNITITGLAASVTPYIITVTDANGCISTVNVTITSTTGTLAATATQTTQAVCLSPNGSATANPSAGTAPYTYAWGNSQTTQTATGLVAGSYPVTVTDANGCTVSATAVVTASPGTLAVTAAQTQQASCGVSNGTATATATGGTTPYTYAWSGTPTQTTVVATGLGAGVRTVTVTDANGCSATATVTITQQAAPAAATFTVTQPLCAGQTGSITVTNPVAGVTYSINGVNGTAFTGLAAGSYTIVATLSSCTTNTSPITINAAPSALAITMSQTAAACTNTGTATATVSGGTTAYNYVWSGTTQTTATVTGLDNGAISVTVTDANGCTITGTTTVADACIPCNLAATATSTAASCGSANGTATASFTDTGNNTPYTYVWSTSPVQTTATATGLVAGTYTVTISNGIAGCTATATTTVSNLGAPTVVISGQTNTTCGLSNGAYTINVTVGTAPITISINGGTATAITLNTPVTFNNLASGTYNITVLDANNCAANSTVTIGASTPLAITATSVNPTTCAGTNGTATVTTAGLTYAWSANAANQTTQTATGLAAGTYSVTAISAAGCTATATVTLVDPTAPAVATFTVTQPLCGGQTGTITVTNPVAGVTYSINGVNGTVFTGLAAGSYTIVATLNACTSSTAAITINAAPSALAITMAQTPASCVNDGTATATVSGGTLPYTYIWTGGQTTSSLTGLDNGAISVTVTDANGCTITGTTSVVDACVPCALAVTTTSTDASCGQANGTATANFTDSGSFGPYDFAWSTTPPQFSATATGLTAGVYTVIVTNSLGCTAGTSAAVSNVGAPTVVVSGQTNTTCGASNGAYTVTVTSGTAPITISINGGTATAITLNTPLTFNNLASGTYNITVLDANSCATNNTVTIGASTPLAITATSVNPTTCGGTNGTATVTTAGLTYAWPLSAASQTTQTATGLAAGTYIVTATNATGCTATATVTLVNPNAPAVATFTVTQPVCGGQTGTITVTNPVAGVTYSINGVNGTVFTGLAAGSYTIVATLNACTSSTAAITINAAPSTLVLTLTPSCVSNAGVVTASATGGTAPYTFSSSLGANQTGTASYNNVAAGTYTITVTDANACTTNSTVVVPNCSVSCNLAISNISVTNATCGASNGTATVTMPSAATNYTYVWSPNTGTANAAGNTRSGLVAGSYTVTVTETATGCTILGTANISNSGAASLAVTNNTSAGCGASNGSLTITTNATGAFTIALNGQVSQTVSPATFSNLAVGTYTATVTDANGCQTIQSVSVLGTSTLTITASGVNPTTCTGSNGTATVNTAGLTYLWSNGQTTQTATGLADGTYTVTATNATGCTATATVTLQDPGAPAIPTGTVTAALCSGGTGTITVSNPVGGVTYTLYNASNTQVGVAGTSFTGLAVGSYTIHATLSGCTSISTSLTVTAPSTLSITLSGSCVSNAGVVTASAAGGTPTYTFSSSLGANQTGSASYNNVAAGTYTITVTDANTCTSSGSVVVPNCTVSCNLAISNVSVTNATCGASNGAATVTMPSAAPNYTYVWSPVNGTANAAGNTRTGLAAGTYTIVVTETATGCTASGTAVITTTPALTITVSGVNPTACGAADGTASVSPAGLTYVWSNGSNSQTATGLTAGTYGVTATNASGCSASATVTLQDAGAPAVPTGTVTQALCSGGTGTITVSNPVAGVTYTLYNASNTQVGVAGTSFSGLVAGTYTIHATLSGCTSISATSLTVTPPSALVITMAQTAASCVNDGTATATVSGGTTPYTYVWTDSQATVTATGLDNGAIVVTVTDNNGCTATATISVGDNCTPPSCNLVITTITATDASCGQANGSATVNYTGGTAPVNFSWNTTPGQSNQTATGLLAGVYTVVLTDATGCTAAGSTAISNIGAPTVTTSNLQNASCGLSNGAITVTGSAGTVTIQLDNNTPVSASTTTFTGIAAGTHTITVTNASGCQTIRNITINSSSVLAITATAVNPTACGTATGSATVTTSGLSYVWSTSPLQQTTQTANNLAAGTYTVTATNAQGCTASTTVSLNDPNAPAVPTLTVAQAICSGGTGTITVNSPVAGVTYTLLPSGTVGTTFTVAAGTYSVQAELAGCTSNSASATINTIPTLTLNASASCVGSNATVTANATGGTGASYTFSFPGQLNQTGTSVTFNNNLSTGAQTVTVTDANGCTATATVTVPNNCAPPPACNLSISSITSVNANCGQADGSATVSFTETPLGSNYTFTWNPANSGQTINNVAAGTYTVTVTNTTSGCSAVSSTVISNNGAPTITISNQTAASCGASNGAFTATGSAGTVSVQLNNNTPVAGTTATFTGLTAGNYTVTVLDANGCLTNQIVTINASSALTITTSRVNPTTCTGTNGSATVNTSGLTYLWSNGQITQTATGLADGTYIVTVTNASGCTATASAVLNDPTAPAAPIGVISQAIACAGGSATITVSNPVANTTYTLLPNNVTGTTYAGIGVGTYTIHATNNISGCSSNSAIITVTSPSALAINLGQTAASCINDGTATATVSGGASPYTYAWTGGQTSATAIGLDNGAISVTVTDNSGCTASATISVDDNCTPPTCNLAISSVAATNASCGQANGSATVNYTGGTAPITIEWGTSPIQTGQTATGLLAGIYTVTVTDATGCTAVANAVISNAGAPTVTLSNTQNASCGLANGSTTITVNSGVAPLTLVVDGGAPQAITVGAAQLVSNLSAGTHNLTITDANGCQTNRVITIGANSALSITATGTNPSACAAADGTATVTTAGLTYQWSTTPPQTTQTATGLTAGTYTVLATDGNGCTASATVTLNDPNAPATPTLTTVQPTCAGGTGTVTVNSPVAGVTYTLLPTGTTGTTFTVGAGTYTVQAALAGCVSNSSAVTITAPATLNLNVSQICQGTTATVTASANGGAGTSYTYTSPFAGQTSNTTGVFNSISAGTYTITVTDANACTTSAAVVVQSCTTPPTCALTIANISTVQATCGTSDGTATVNFTDDAGTTHTILWSNGFNTASITGLAAGSYTVTVTNNLGCSATATTTISNNGAPTATISNIVAATCGNNNGAFTVTGGVGTASIQLGTATPIAASTNTFTNLAAGTYTVTIIDVNGCQTVSTATIGATSTLTITATGVNPTTCGGANGTATVTAAGLTYQWSNGQLTQTTTGLTAGTYTVAAIDVNGCTASATVALSDPGAPAAPTATVTQPLCAGGTGSIVVNNPVANVTYTLLPTATVGTTFNNLTAGTYTVQASLAGCVSNSASIVITNPSTLTLNLASVCQGSTATVTATATGGASSYLYTFNGNPPTANNTFAGVAQGTYIVSVVDANACSTSASIAVQDCTPACNLVITSVAVTDASCGQANGSATVNYTGGTAPVTFEWNTAPVGQFNQTATGLLAGVYTVTITDANGCTATANAVVSNVGAPVASISSLQDATCGLSNGAFTVTVTSGAAPLTISLDGGAAQAIALNTPRVFNNLTAATHTITITDANGCITNRNITIGSGSALTLSISTTAPTSCSANDGTATVSPAGLTYSWSTGASSQTITGLSGGIVTVTATNAQGCTATASATLNPVGGPTTPVLSVAQPSCAGGTGTITVSNAIGGVVYTLNGGTPATTFTGLADGTYTIVATLNGCTSSATATVIVPSQITLNVSAACNNNLGEATATANGGTGLYTFTLGAQTVNGTSASFTPLAQGAYTISVSDANGCATSAPVTVPNCVTVPVCNLTIANVATVQATCGSSNGSATVTISDPGAAASTTYNYTWNPSISTTASATGLTAGAYNVTVSSSTGCTASATANISNSGGPVVTISNTQNAACGSADGSFSVTVVSGSPTFTVAVNGQPTQNNIATGSTVNFANLVANTYTVTVTDLNGCVTINTVDITTTPSFTVTANGNNPTTCGGSNGTATVTAGASYLWSNSLTTQSINTLSAGIYNVTVTNAAGCTATASVTLQDPGAPSVSGTVTQAITCAGGTGAISVTNPQAGVVYTLYNGNTALSSFTGLAAGTYTIQAALGTCVGVSTPITITAPATLQLNLAATDQTCSPDGAINASASGGTAPYTYTGAGLTTQTGSSVVFNNLAQGNYTVTVTDANGCSTSAVITVGINCPNPPTCNLIVSSITGTDATCGSANGTATVNFTESPLGTYTFAWSPSVGTTASVTGLSAGVAYNVTVTSVSTGCTASAANPIVLSNAGGPAVGISNIQDATCTAQNGSFTVTVTAGTSNFSVAIDGVVQTTSLPLNTAFVANNLLAGAHTIVVTDANGCITSRTVTVGQSNANITVTAVQTQAASCGGGTNGTATASANGGTAPYTYVWSNQTGSVATGLAAGSYTVTVVDANGCSASTSVSISELNAPAVPTLTVTQPICSGQTGSIAVQSPVAGVTYTLYAGTVVVGSATSFTGLVANVNYTVEAVNASGCTAVSNVVTINTPSTFTLSIGTTAASCTNDGTATLTVNGGTAPYSYAWSTSGSTTNTATGLDNGAISATVTDANGCSVAINGTVADNCVIANCSGFVISNVATVQATCGTSNGSATVNFTDPNASAGTTYTYVWSASANGQNTASVINLAAGAISVTVSSSIGCTATYTTGISNVAGPSATVSNIVNATCTAADGAVTISTNALTPFTIVLNGVTSTTTPATFTGLAAGTYTAVITDVNGCITTRTITIGSNNASFTVTATDVNPTTCGGTNGTATVTAGASYLWSTTATTQSINGLAAGLYTVTVTNASGCTSSTSVTLQDGGTTVPTATVANVACYGGTNGVITVIAPSAGTTYTLYDANNQAVGAAGTSFTGLSAGTYTVHAVNAAGCTSISTSLTVTQPATLVLNVQVNDSYCNNNTGSIITTVTGGSSAYNYNWSGGATTAGLSGLATGTTENLTVTDANGCTVSALNLVVGNICPPACDLNFTGVTVINTACGNNNGSITVTATSTAGNFTYSWTAPNGTVFQTTTNTATGLVAGTYTFTITDANGCQIDSTVAINNTNGPNLTVSSITPANCTAADGSFTLAITGGVAPYNVTWNGGNTTINTNAATVIGSLAAGNYTVGVTDVNGCFNSQIITIGTNSALTATVGTLVEPTCTQANGAIPFTVNGGTAPYNYSLDGTVIFSNSVQTTETFTGLAAGTYNICVSDANGCQVCQTVVLNNAGATAVNITDFTLAQPSCPQQNGSLTGGPGGSTTYEVWQGTTLVGAVPQSNLVAGTYELRATDINGCQSSVLFTITAKPDWNVVLSPSNETCANNDGSISVSVSGATPNYTFAWSNNGTTNPLTGLSQGTYAVTITDGLACTTTASVVIDSICATPCNLQISGIIVNNATCGQADGGIQLQVTGGTPNFTYTWSPNVSTTADANSLTAGVYSVTVVDAVGCSDIASNIVVANTSGAVISATASSATCTAANGAVTITAVSGTAPFTAQLVGVAGTQTIATVTGTTTFTGLAAGTYAFLVTDANGCVSTTTQTVQSNNSGITVNTTIITAPSCNAADGVVNLAATNGTAPYTYIFDGVATGDNVTGVQAGVYTVVATDANGCVATTTVTVSDANGPTLTASNFAVTDITCPNAVNGSIAVMNGQAGVTYTIALGNTIASFPQTNLPEGCYTVYAAENGCVSALQICIGVPADWDITVSATAQTCAGSGNIDLTVAGASGPYTYSWNTVPSLNTQDISVDEGTYMVTINDSNGCSTTAMAMVGNDCVPLPPVAVDDSTSTNDITPINIVVTHNDTLRGADTIYIVSQPQVGTVALVNDSTIVYTPVEDSCGVTYSFQYAICNAVGCDTATVYVEILCPVITVYNGFSPNGDNYNEVFTIHDIERFPNNEILIYNRWGNLVYKTRGYTNDNGWKGTFDGKDLPDGTYFYILKLNDNRYPAPINGYIELHR